MKEEKWLDKRFQDRPDFPAGFDLPARAHLRWRLEKLAETIDWAVNRSAFFRRSLARRLTDQSIKGLKKAAQDNDLAAAENLMGNLPFCTSAQLAADSGLFMAVSHDEVEGAVSVPSSGTSGPAKRIFSTAADLEETVAFFQYGMRFLVQPGRDRVALAMSQARPGNVADLLGRALKRLDIPFWAQGFVPQPGREENWLAELISWRPTCLVGVPAQMLALSLNPAAADLKDSLRCLLLSGDVAEDGLVRALERNFSGCRVFRHYGSTETGLGGAVECGRRLWPHLRDDLWVEIVDEKGRAIPEGPGEIVITPLTRRAMPLVRYLSGDEGELLTAPCPCGSILPRLKVYGRLTDRLKLPGGRIIRASDFEQPLFSLPFVRDYRPAYSPGPPLSIRLTIIPSPDYPPEAASLAEEKINDWLRKDRAHLELEIHLRSPERQPDEKALGGKRRFMRL